ncbi:PepSY domain-containing protein [Sphingobacterium shayense]|uniref:PepSY-associated TM helix domain-containing protein n=1 Tax=Sphingobacterium shayense TaxID=626343 RepID=UPI0015562079|nr:PepSY-associated TM helix domain-containing protein [Sphingobacterium shayense]NQD69900.1 PepSY domain-containing protein [Sphingobacterium shayense]
MNIRNYNIYFNTHTISGIIICAILYVIFFAGSFSFFKKEITAWQSNTSYHQQPLQTANYTHLLDSISQTGYNLHGRDIIFYLQQGGLKGYVNFSASHDSVTNKENLAALKDVEGGSRRGRGRRGVGDTKYFSHDFLRMQSGDYSSDYDMGEFLYRLHFLAQLNEVPIRVGFAPFGYLVAGITSFIFLFALITGLLLHWDKIVSNFFVFRPFSKWKTVWTDMHTALGVIGFPYQFIFAVTGVILIINSALLVPFGKFLYEGDMDKVYQDLDNANTYPLSYSYKPLEKDFDLGAFLDNVQQKWPESTLKRVSIQNYGDENMYVVAVTDPKYDKSFAGSGVFAMQVKDGKILEEKSPFSDVSYIDGVRSLIYRLHFGDFGGYPVKIIYFALGVMGCLVIISGILIWLVARDKNNVIPRKRKFNFWTANVFLAICLTMLPVTAVTFIAIKVYPDVNQQFIYRVFFHLWWILSLYYIIRRNLNRTNRETLLLGGIFSLFVPVANGIVTGNWLWVSASSGKWDLFVVDFLFLFLGVVSLVVLKRLKEFNERPQEQSKNKSSRKQEAYLSKV